MKDKFSLHHGIDRRTFLRVAGLGASSAALAWQNLAAANPEVKLPPLQNEATEGPEPQPPDADPPSERVGFAIVGLGHIALEQTLPAFAKCKHARPVALVSGTKDKAKRVAQQYGVNEQSVYDYSAIERLADNPAVQAVYIALPNALHAEYTLRAAKAGKHVLCEKPMATTVADAEKMIAACRDAQVKLMIGYRSQYEPMDRAIVKAVRAQKLGKLREFISSNSINQGDPSQWRLKLGLAGGGPLPDVGIYSINAARFLSGEEPVEVMGTVFRPTDDPRFREVEATAQFILRFPSGYTAACSCSYATHRSQFLRLNGEGGWAELDPAFAYQGLKLRLAHLADGHPQMMAPAIVEKNQFALELDHFAECVRGNIRPHTPGEEGLQDLKIIAAIYESARSGRPVKLAAASDLRGPDPQEEMT